MGEGVLQTVYLGGEGVQIRAVGGAIVVLVDRAMGGGVARHKGEQ
jgi:hypothetical protein